MAAPLNVSVVADVSVYQRWLDLTVSSILLSHRVCIPEHKTLCRIKCSAYGLSSTGH